MLTQSRFDFFCRAVTDFGVKHVVLVQNKKEIFAHHWEPDEPVLQYSVAKSFTACAVGYACAEGILDLEDPVVSFFPEEVPGQVNERLRSLKVKHLITMQTGQRKPYLMGYQRKTMQEKDWVRFVLRQPQESEPGKEFCYSNVGPYLAGLIVQRRSGQSLEDYLTPRLFEPLGIAKPEWDKDPLGNTFGAGGLYLRTADLAQFGRLFLEQGKRDGIQVLPEGWTRKVDRTTILTTEEQQNYSLGFWRSRHDSISAVGRHGQYCTIVPEKNLIIAMNGFNEQDENLLEYVWTYLYPNL